MSDLTAALCCQLPTPAEGETADGWRVVIPAPDAHGWVRGADGRAWRLGQPQAVVAAFNHARPIDANHAEALKAPSGEAAPAYGWIEAIRATDDGAIEGRLAFTPRGTEAVGNREYRYLSPVFKFDRASKQIRSLDSAALVNTPNFALALNRAGAPDPDAPDPPEATAMDLVAELRSALNLKDDADEPAVLDAVKQQASELATARNRPADTPSLDQFVPRADYDALATAKNHAEARLAERDTADHAAQVETAINAAQAAGKITPATEAYHRAMCRTAEGLAEFKQYAAAAPEIGGASGLADKRADPAGAAALTDDEKAACRAMGVAEATYRERRDADAQAFG